MSLLRNQEEILEHLREGAGARRRVVRLEEVHESAEYVLLAMECLRGHSLLHFTNPLPIPEKKPQPDKKSKKRRFLSLMPHYFQRQRIKRSEQGVSGREALNEQQCAKVMAGVLEAVEFIHSRNIIHRDLKPQNIVLEKKGDLGSVKLIDFGLSTYYRRSMAHRISERCGTVIFMAPEQAEKQRYGKAVDMWACGVILFQLITGDHPFYDATDTQASLLEKMCEARPNWPSSVSPLAQDLFSKLCCYNPTGRYNASRALQHPWITRKLAMPVPLTLREEFSQMEREQSLQKIVRLLYFLSVVKGGLSESFEISEDYRQQLLEPAALLELNQTNLSDDIEAPLIHIIKLGSTPHELSPAAAGSRRKPSTPSEDPSIEPTFSNLLSASHLENSRLSMRARRLSNSRAPGSAKRQNPLARRLSKQKQNSGSRPAVLNNFLSKTPEVRSPVLPKVRSHEQLSPSNLLKPLSPMESFGQPRAFTQLEHYESKHKGSSYLTNTVSSHHKLTSPDRDRELSPDESGKPPAVPRGSFFSPKSSATRYVRIRNLPKRKSLVKDESGSQAKMQQQHAGAPPLGSDVSERTLVSPRGAGAGAGATHFSRDLLPAFEQGGGGGGGVGQSLASHKQRRPVLRRAVASFSPERKQSNFKKLAEQMQPLRPPRRPPL